MSLERFTRGSALRTALLLLLGAFTGALVFFAGTAGTVLHESPSRHAGGAVNRALLDVLHSGVEFMATTDLGETPLIHGRNLEALGAPVISRIGKPATLANSTCRAVRMIRLALRRSRF